MNECAADGGEYESGRESGDNFFAAQARRAVGASARAKCFAEAQLQQNTSRGFECGARFAARAAASCERLALLRLSLSKAGRSRFLGGGAHPIKNVIPAKAGTYGYGPDDGWKRCARSVRSGARASHVLKFVVGADLRRHDGMCVGIRARLTHLTFPVYDAGCGAGEAHTD